MKRIDKNKTGLVLEGGGIRGAYTAGALTWLAEQGLYPDYSVGISSGAAYLSLYVSREMEIAHDMSTGFSIDPQNVGIRALLKCGHYVDGDRIFTHFLKNVEGFRTKKLRDMDFCMEVGAYDLEEGKTVYYSNKDMDDDLMLIRAACSLPIASNIVAFRGRKLLDGGITKMIPIERALEQGCGRILVITTKPAGYVRKPASKMVKFLMSFAYRKYPSVKRDYHVRHRNYYKQIRMVNSLVESGKALHIAPSATVKVNRFKGDPDKCQTMFRMGYDDMEARKEEILNFWNKKDREYEKKQ